MTTANKLGAFVWKDWQQARSYRLSFLLQSIGIIIPLVGLVFLSRVFDDVNFQTLSRYGGDYISFALFGAVLAGYTATALRSFSGSLRIAQFTGTFEVLLLTKASLPTILIGWALYPFIRATLYMILYIIGGFIILGISVEDANLLGAALTIMLATIIMGSLGIMAASFTLVFKQNDPFTAAIVLAAGLLSGTIYPVDVLPGWLQGVALVLPQTYALESLRLSILSGYSLSNLTPQLVPLLLFSIILIPAGIYTFKYAMYRAKMDGSLAHY